MGWLPKMVTPPPETKGNPLISAGPTGVTPPPNPISAGTMAAFFGMTPDQGSLGIVWDEAWSAVVNGHFTDGPRGKHKVDIHLIWCIGEAAALNQHPNVNEGIEAFRKVDFVVTSSHFLTTNAKYSDVVLPATTQWERDGALLTGNREMMIYGQKAVEPLLSKPRMMELQMSPPPLVGSKSKSPRA